MDSKISGWSRKVSTVYKWNKIRQEIEPESGYTSKIIIVWNNIRKNVTVPTIFNEYGVIANPRAFMKALFSLILLCMIVNTCFLTNET
jgi:hypothetical protein